MKDDFYIEAYKNYRKECRNSSFLQELSVIEYDIIEKPKCNNLGLMVYSEFLLEHTNQLVNDIHSFRLNLIKLNSWNNVIHKYSEQEKFNLLVEFLEPLLVFLHDLPYSINNRFIFSLSHLCHQANRYTLDEWKDDLPEDSSIKYKTMNKYCSKWEYFDEFLLKLKKLSGDEYLRETNEYRNRLHHRIPIYTEIGISNMMSRKKINDTGEVSYSFGYIEPMPLSKTINLLKQQYIAMCSCFYAYKKLLNYQVVYIDSKVK